MSLIDTFRTSFGENDQFWVFRAIDNLIGFIRLKLAEPTPRRTTQISTEKEARRVPRSKLDYQYDSKSLVRAEIGGKKPYCLSGSRTERKRRNYPKKETTIEL